MNILDCKKDGERMDKEMILTLEQELIADLTEELKITDEDFNDQLLRSKVQNALREVKRARKYPSFYTDRQIEADMYQYYSNIRNIALYDYNSIGMDFQSASSENSTSRTLVDRDKLFGGIIPLSKC